MYYILLYNGIEGKANRWNNLKIKELHTLK